MNLVRESISFQRGIDPKQALDVGNLRSENMEKYITDSVFGIVKDNLSVFDRERKAGVNFFIKGWRSMSNFNPSVWVWSYIPKGQITRLNLMKKKVISWIEDNTPYKVVNAIKDKSGCVQFKLKAK